VVPPPRAKTTGHRKPVLFGGDSLMSIHEQGGCDGLPDGSSRLGTAVKALTN
jgi:hypothetical protein